MPQNHLRAGSEEEALSALRIHAYARAVTPARFP